MSRFTMAMVALALAAGAPTASAQNDDNRRDHRRDKKDDQPPHRERDHRRRPPTKPMVRGFGPKAGPPGTKVTIRGLNLPDHAQVLVGRQRVDAAQAGPRSIRFEIPRVPPGKHRISIQAGAARIPVGSFEVRGGPVVHEDHHDGDHHDGDHHGGDYDDHHDGDHHGGDYDDHHDGDHHDGDHHDGDHHDGDHHDGDHHEADNRADKRHRPRGHHWYRERMMATRFWPQKGPPGTRVVVHGNNFAPDTVVMLGRRQVKPMRVTKDRVVFKIPRGHKGDIIRLSSPSTRRQAVVGSFEFVSGYDPVAEQKKLEAERKRLAQERWKKRQHDLAKGRAARRAAFEKWERERRETRQDRRSHFLETLRKKWERAFLRDDDTRAELALHAERSARLERMKHLAEANGSGKLAVRIDVAMQREDQRHEHRMASLKAAFKVD